MHRYIRWKLCLPEDQIPEAVSTAVKIEVDHAVASSTGLHHRDFSIEEARDCPGQALLPTQVSHSLANNVRYQAIRRMLLLNAYPLAYIILSIPGIVNRLLEASGHKSHIMQAIQASMQFVGLANALTYGWNERMGTRVRERFRR